MKLSLISLNQYVNYTKESPSVLKADELSEGHSETEIYQAVCDFMGSEFSYDFCLGTVVLSYRCETWHCHARLISESVILRKGCSVGAFADGKYVVLVPRQHSVNSRIQVNLCYDSQMNLVEMPAGFCVHDII